MMRGFNVVDLNQLLSLLLHYAGEDLYDIFEAIPEDQKPAIAAQDANPAQDAGTHKLLHSTAEYWVPEVQIPSHKPTC